MWRYESEGWSLILWILRDINFVGTPHNPIDPSPVFEHSPQPKPETYFVAERYLCIFLGPCISACVERGNQIQVCTPHRQPERREPTLGRMRRGGTFGIYLTGLSSLFWSPHPAPFDMAPRSTSPTFIPLNSFLMLAIPAIISNHQFQSCVTIRK